MGARTVSFVMHFDPQPAVVAAARACEQDVFLRSYGNTADQWDEEYGPYDASSVFLAVTEPGGDVVACCRIVLPSPVGLKSLVDVRRPPWHLDGARAAKAAQLDLDRTWDVATVAVRKGAAKGGLLSAALYHGLFRATRANNARWIVMIMDVRARRLLDLLHLETNVLPAASSGPYLGSSSSLPLWAEVSAMVDGQRLRDPESYRLVTLGGGLSDVSVPTDEAFRLGARRSVTANPEHVPQVPAPGPMLRE